MKISQILVVSCLFLLLLSGCGREEYKHRFGKGDFVISKIDGRKGMVTAAYRYHDGLYVRFSSETHMTTSSFLGGTHDLTSKPYVKVFMHDFELMPMEVESWK